MSEELKQKLYDSINQLESIWMEIEKRIYKTIKL